MRKMVLIMLILLLIFPVKSARHEFYSEATPSDEGIYVYFSEMLGDSERILDRILDEDPNALNLSASLHHKLELFEEESRFYTAKGVKSNVSAVVKPFLSLSAGMERFAQSQSIFLNSNNSELNARTALARMKLSADEINSSLDEIEQIELWNGTEKLNFDTSALKSKLKDVYDLIAYYESLLARFEGEGIVVVVSNDHPFLYQEITMFVYAKNVTQISLFIDSMEYSVEYSGYSKRHSFNELGEHTIYAEGVSNKSKGKVRSNVVSVYVSKIPTYIVLSSKSAAFLNENVRVSGYLSDYYGNPVETNVTVRVDGGAELIAEKGSEKGFFSFNVTKSSEGFLNVSAFYAGNETYEGSNASISIFFSRFPVSLYIKADKTQVSVNETVGFMGRIDVNNPVPIHVFVNSAYAIALNAADEFNFTLNFPASGKYAVYAYFPGDSLHKPAESNRIEILVDGSVKTISIYYLFLLLIVAIVLTLGGGVYAKRRRGIEAEDWRGRRQKEKGKEKEKMNEKEIVKEKREVKAETLPENLEEAYRTLFRILVDKYGLKKSLTPRELLKALKDRPFAEKLDAVTQIHERAVYGEMELKKEETEIYFRLIAEILEEMK